MSHTASNLPCPHCDARPSARDIAEGWCDSCGKRLPSAVAPWVKRAAPEAAPTPPAAAPAGWPVWSAGAALAGSVLALAALGRMW